MTSMEEAVNQLVAELNKKKRYLQQLKTLAQKQSAALEKEDPAELSGFLEARGQIVSELKALDAKDGRASEFFMSASGNGNPQTAPPQEALGIVGEIESLIREIQAIDKENLAVATEQRDELKKGLQDIGNHRKSQKLYMRKGKGISGAFLNKRR